MCISKCFCYFNSQGASSHEFKTFRIRFWRQSPAGTTWGIWEKWKLIECRAFCGASRVKNSVKWCHPRVASPCPKNWQPLTHTKPPLAFPGLETMLRKLNLPAKFTTPCQNIGISHIASRIIIALLHMYREHSKSEERISNACMLADQRRSMQVCFLYPLKMGLISVHLLWIIHEERSVSGCADQRALTKSSGFVLF